MISKGAQWPTSLHERRAHVHSTITPSQFLPTLLAFSLLKLLPLPVRSPQNAVGKTWVLEAAPAASVVSRLTS